MSSSFAPPSPTPSFVAGSATPSANSPANTTAPWNGDPDMVQGPRWPKPLKEWQTVCAAGWFNVTDKCCAEQNGSIYVDNSTSFAGPGQHQCMINTTTEVSANASRKAFGYCATWRDGGVISSCDSYDPKRSSAKRVAVAVVGLVWVAAGCALAL